MFTYISRFNKKDRAGINLIGYFPYAFGVAEIGRFFSKYLKKSAIPFSIYNIETAHTKLDLESLSPYISYFTTKPAYYKNIFFVNAELITWIKVLHPLLFVGRYNAAVFFWEFDDYFYFDKAFKVIDEAIAMTEFIATALRKAAPAGVKVTKFPIPFIKNWELTQQPQAVRKQHGIPSSAYTFIFNFDFKSVYQRKNPEAILFALEKAFQTTDDVCLVLKTINADDKSANFQHFQQLLTQSVLADKVILVNGSLSRNDLMNLINAADCYISLHRSEGLGLGMLEAMSMGKPVIGTAYGGNTDFMNHTNALLVGYEPVAVQPGNEPYKAGWMWAEPNVEQAAQYMHQLYTNRNFAAQLGQKAQQSVKEQFNNEVFAKAVTTWMQS